MKVKLWNKIFIGLCALAVTGMVGVPKVMAESCSIGGSTNPIYFPGTGVLRGQTVNYNLAINPNTFASNDDTCDTGAGNCVIETGTPCTVDADCEITTTLPLEVQNVLVVKPLCKFPGCSGDIVFPTGSAHDAVFTFSGCTINTLITDVYPAAGCTQVTGDPFVPDGSILIDIGNYVIPAGGSIDVGQLQFTAVTPLTPALASNLDFQINSIATTKYFFATQGLKVPTGNPLCAEQTGDAEGSTKTTFPPLCGDLLLNGSVNAHGFAETCDPPEELAQNQCEDPDGDGNYDCIWSPDACTINPDTCPGVPTGDGVNNVCRGPGNDQCTFCGDGVENPLSGELCDLGFATNSDDPDSECRTDCTLPVCGDGVVDPNLGETCDYGITDPNDPDFVDGCRDTGPDACTYCGDGGFEPNSGELCDFAITDPNDPGFDPNCNDICEIDPVCGDGLINQPGETCDYGITDPNDPDFVAGCRGPGPDECTYCGDGGFEPGSGELCDPAITDPNDPGFDPNCNDICEIDPVCGDGLINQPSETCDYGITDPNDPDFVAGCRGPGPDECTYCGDGGFEPNSGELCDFAITDPNAPGFDENCNDICEIDPACGDGNLDPDETCDPGITDPNAPGYAANCRLPGEPFECTYCGDGIEQPVGPGDFEQCDDGNDIETDGCNSECLDVPCDVDIQKEVNCGAGWVDDCTTFDGELIDVRYVVTNISGTDAVQCTITESNPVIGAGIGPFDLTVLAGQTIIDAGPDVVCSDNAEADEPDTATITCTCAGDPPAAPGQVTDSDQANFECINCGVDIVKGVGATGGPYGDAYTTVDHQLVGYEITISSTGDNVVGDCFLEDAMLFPAPIPVVPGQAITVPNQQCEDGVVGDNDIEGINTATVTCATCFDAAGNPLTPDTPYTATDTADLDCLTPDVSTTKSCDEQPDGGGYTYTFTFDNPGDTEFECAIYDTLTPGACGDPTGSTDPLVTLSNVPMNDAGPYVWTFENVPITETSCNNATIACTVINPATGAAEMDECNPDSAPGPTCVWSGEPCDPAGPIDQCGPKMIVEDINAPCEVLGGCFTRTPGFWGSKRKITQVVLGDDGVNSCGVNLWNVEYELQGSAVEDTCSTGNDKSYVNYEPQQIQLIRQCTAAALNAKASMMLGGTCASFDIGYGFDNFADAFDTCCGGEGEGTCSDGAVNDNCIMALDEFNNWEGADELVWDDMCDFQDNDKGGDNCGANNCNKEEVGKRARNNGWVNCRPEISPTGCPD